MLVEQVVVEVADDEAQLDLGRVARDEHGVDVALALLGRLGREARPAAGARGSRPASLIAFTSSPFAQPGWIARPRMCMRTCAPENVSRLHLAGGRAVDRVGGDGAEALDREVDDAAADLLVGVERDLHRAVRDLRVRDEIGDRGHDLGDAGLVVGAEERRAVGRDQLVADVVLELRRLARADHLARVAEHDLAAVVADPLRRDVRRRSPRARCRRGRRTRSSAPRGRRSPGASPVT